MLVPFENRFMQDKLLLLRAVQCLAAACKQHLQGQKRTKQRLWVGVEDLLDPLIRR